MLRKLTVFAFLGAIVMATAACGGGPGDVSTVPEGERPEIGNNQFDPTKVEAKPSNDPTGSGGQLGIAN